MTLALAFVVQFASVLQLNVKGVHFHYMLLIPGFLPKCLDKKKIQTCKRKNVGPICRISMVDRNFQ